MFDRPELGQVNHAPQPGPFGHPPLDATPPSAITPTLFQAPHKPIFPNLVAPSPHASASVVQEEFGGGEINETDVVVQDHVSLQIIKVVSEEHVFGLDAGCFLLLCHQGNVFLSYFFSPLKAHKPKNMSTVLAISPRTVVPDTEVLRTAFCDGARLEDVACPPKDAW